MFLLIYLAIGTGIGLGIGIIGLIWLFRRNQVIDSFVSSDRLMGAYGVVEIPFSDRRPGKVRINMGDSVLSLRALAFNSEQFELGDCALVVAVGTQCVLVVSSL